MKLELVQAKRMYADNKSIDEIASALNKSKGTVYRWIKDNKEMCIRDRKGDNMRKLAIVIASILIAANKQGGLNVEIRKG